MYHALYRITILIMHIHSQSYNSAYPCNVSPSHCRYHSASITVIINIQVFTPYNYSNTSMYASKWFHENSNKMKILYYYLYSYISIARLSYYDYYCKVRPSEVHLLFTNLSRPCNYSTYYYYVILDLTFVLVSRSLRTYNAE